MDKLCFSGASAADKKAEEIIACQELANKLINLLIKNLT